MRSKGPDGALSTGSALGSSRHLAALLHEHLAVESSTVVWARATLEAMRQHGVEADARAASTLAALVNRLLQLGLWPSQRLVAYVKLCCQRPSCSQCWSRAWRRSSPPRLTRRIAAAARRKRAAGHGLLEAAASGAARAARQSQRGTSSS